MTRKARLWTGATLMIVLALNYGMMAVPLIKKRADIKERTNEIVVNNSADDDYVLDIFRKERAAIDKKMGIIDCVGLSLAVIIASWTVFGLIMHKDGAKARKERG